MLLIDFEATNLKAVQFVKSVQVKVRGSNDSLIIYGIIDAPSLYFLIIEKMECHIKIFPLSQSRNINMCNSSIQGLKGLILAAKYWGLILPGQQCDQKSVCY